MPSGSRPLLSTVVPTRQNYLSFTETIDPLYHTVDSSTTCSSFSQSIRESQFNGDEYVPHRRCRTSRDSTIETLHDNMDHDELKASKRLPTDNIAYVQHMEKFFNLFSSSLYLENKVAVARDHLANERTYLAWVRTSLSTISISVAITQLFRLDKDVAIADDLVAIGRPMGMCFIVIGMLYMVFAFIRYFHSQVAMTKGYFPASRGIIIFASTATLTALLAVFLIIVQKN